MALTQEQQSLLREKLEAERAKLEQEIAAMTHRTADGGVAPRFPEDLGSDVDENAAEVEEFVDTAATVETLERRLEDVKAALQKMDNGTYGICEKTGQEIPLARLMANPAARTTVTAPPSEA